MRFCGAEDIGPTLPTMKARLHLAMVGALLISQTAIGAAGAIYKCVDGEGSTAYQSDACPAGARRRARTSPP